MAAPSFDIAAAAALGLDCTVDIAGALVVEVASYFDIDCCCGYCWSYYIADVSSDVAVSAAVIGDYLVDIDYYYCTAVSFVVDILLVADVPFGLIVSFDN